MRRCLLPFVVVLLASIGAEDIIGLDLGLVGEADAQQRRRTTRRRTSSRNRNRNRGRNNRGRGNRYQNSRSRMQQQQRAAINRMRQQQRAAMQKQQQAYKAYMAKVKKVQDDAKKGIYTAPNGAKLVQGYRDYDLVSASEVTVRRMELPLEFGLDGKAQKPSPEQLKELKGDNPKLPGYTAKFEDLQVGQLVKITCAVPKQAKDADKIVWVPAGLVAGQIAAIESQRITVRVTGLIPMKDKGKITKIPVTDREAKLVVIVKAAGGDVPGGSPASGGFGDFGNFGGFGDKK